VDLVTSQEQLLHDKWNHLPHHLLELDSVDLFVVNNCMHVNNYHILCIDFFHFLGLVPLDTSMITGSPVQINKQPESETGAFPTCRK